MEQLIKTLKEWQEEATANEFCGLKEAAVYQKVIDEIEKMKVNSEIKDRIEQADRKETNFEHYKNELIETLLDILAVTEDGRILACDDAVCEECIWGEQSDCITNARKWLMSEHRPQEKRIQSHGALKI